MKCDYLLLNIYRGFFAQRVLGKEREVDLFPSKFLWSLPGSHSQIISSNFALSGIWGFAGLKNRIFVPVNTNDAPIFKYNINFKLLFSLLSNPEFASFIKACLDTYLPPWIFFCTSPLYNIHLTQGPGASQLQILSVSVASNLSNRKIIDSTGEVSCSPLHFFSHLSTNGEPKEAQRPSNPLKANKAKKPKYPLMWRWVRREQRVTETAKKSPAPAKLPGSTMGIWASWKLFLSESQHVSLAMSILLFLKKHTQAAMMLLRDLFPNPISCTCRRKKKWPKGAWNNTLKTQGSASAIEDCLGLTKPCKQYFCLENRPHSSVNYCMFVPREGFTLDTEELLLSYFPVTARNTISTSIGPCCNDHCIKKDQKSTESAPKLPCSTIHNKA